MPGQPLAARLDADPQRLDLASAVARIETHLARQPEDGRGWEVVAPVYLRSGRYADAVKAYGNALRLLGDDAARLANYGEALVSANEGVVSAEARATFEKALMLEAATPKARYYLARAAEQDGDLPAARAQYTQILSSSPPEAPWVPVVQEELTRISGGAAAAVAALPAEDRQAAIRGMVEGLSQRLEASGGTPEEWTRLVRSYAVLGERDKAARSLTRAREALAQDRSALGRLDVVAQELALHMNDAVQ
jgi:cytochrome c-type biogenesis protein CcmH